MHLLINPAGEVIFDQVKWLVERVIEFTDYWNVPLQGHPHQTLHTEIRLKGTVVERIDFVAGRRIQHQTEMSGVHSFKNRHGLSLRQFPGFPPESRVRPVFLHRFIQKINEAGQPFMQRKATTAGAGAELTANPRLLVIGVDHDVIDLRKAGHEVGKQLHILFLDGRVHDAGGADR